MARGAKGDFHHSRPTRIEREALPGVGDDAPRKRIRVDKDLPHDRYLQLVT